MIFIFSSSSWSFFWLVFMLLCIAVYHVANFLFFTSLFCSHSHTLVRLLVSMNRAKHHFSLSAKRCIPSIYLSNSKNFSCLCMFIVWYFIMPVLTFQIPSKWSVVWVIWMGLRKEEENGITLNAMLAFDWVYKQIESEKEEEECRRRSNIKTTENTRKKWTKEWYIQEKEPEKKWKRSAKMLLIRRQLSFFSLGGVHWNFNKHTWMFCLNLKKRTTFKFWMCRICP